MDEEDDMAALSQDPGYALYLLNLEIEHMGEMLQKEHSLSLEEEIRRDELYFIIRDDIYGEDDEAE